VSQIIKYVLDLYNLMILSDYSVNEGLIKFGFQGLLVCADENTLQPQIGTECTIHILLISKLLSFNKYLSILI
jgi:hypothetical protein